MNIVEDLLGKEVIDDSGNLVGVVKDLVWDFEVNTVDSLVVEKGGGGFLSFGSGEKQLVPYDSIHSIGDKVLINIKFERPVEDTDDDGGLSRFRLGL